MATVLTEVETRVLGALVEKQVTTPEYYPLTINALTAACNQKNNRNPVTFYSESEIANAVESLREKNLVYIFYGSTSRVPKYKHVMPEVIGLKQGELAVLCALMLRGPQTPGELRGNTSRLHEFSSLEEIEEVLTSMMNRESDPLVVRLPRQPGQKEVRYAQLLNGNIPVDSAVVEAIPRKMSSGSDDRVAKLEEEVATLKQHVEELQQQFESFKKQFE